MALPINKFANLDSAPSSPNSFASLDAYNTPANKFAAISKQKELDIPDVVAKKQAEISDRSIGETAQDLAAGIFGVGPINVAESAYGLANLVSDYGNPLNYDGEAPDTLDSTLRKYGLNPDFKAGRKAVSDTFYSDFLKQEIAKVAVKDRTFDAGRKDRMAANRKRFPDAPEWAQQAFEGGAGILDSLNSAAESPSTALQTTAESIAFLSAGKKAATIAEKMGLKGTTGAAAFASGSEAGSINESVKNIILDADYEVLTENSPRYRKLLETNNPEDAKAKLASEQAAEASLTAAGVTALTGKIFKANEAVANLNKKVGLVGGAKNMLKTAVPESQQEIYEEGGARRSENLANKHIDPTVDEFAGVAGAATKGMLSGAASPGSAVVASISEAVPSIALGTAKAAVKGTIAAPKAIKNVVSDVGTATGKAVKGGAELIKQYPIEQAKSKREVAAKTEADVTKAETPIEKAIILSNDLNAPAESASFKEKSDYAEKINQVLVTELATLNEDFSKAAEGKSEEEVAKIAQEFKPRTDEIDRLNGVVQASKKALTMHPEELSKAMSDATGITDPEELKKTIAEVFGSLPKKASPDIIKNIDEITKSPSIDPKDKVRLQNYSNTQKASNAKGVSKQIIDTGFKTKTGFHQKGLVQHQEAIATAAATKDSKLLDSGLTDLSNFITKHSAKLAALQAIVDDPSNQEAIDYAQKEHGWKHTNELNTKLMAGNIAKEVQALRLGYKESLNIAEEAIPGMNESHALKEVPITSTELNDNKNYPEQRTEDPGYRASHNVSIKVHNQYRKAKASTVLKAYKKKLAMGENAYDDEQFEMGGIYFHDASVLAGIMKKRGIPFDAPEVMDFTYYRQNEDGTETDTRLVDKDGKLVKDSKGNWVIDPKYITKSKEGKHANYDVVSPYFSKAVDALIKMTDEQKAKVHPNYLKALGRYSTGKGIAEGITEAQGKKVLAAILKQQTKKPSEDTGPKQEEVKKVVPDFNEKEEVNRVTKAVTNELNTEGLTDTQEEIMGTYTQKLIKRLVEQSSKFSADNVFNGKPENLSDNALSNIIKKVSEGLQDAINYKEDLTNKSKWYTAGQDLVRNKKILDNHRLANMLLKGKILSNKVSEWFKPTKRESASNNVLQAIPNFFDNFEENKETLGLDEEQNQALNEINDFVQEFITTFKTKVFNQYTIRPVLNEDGSQKVKTIRNSKTGKFDLKDPTGAFDYLVMVDKNGELTAQGQKALNEDLSQYFSDDNGQFDSNFIASMAIEALNWTVTRGQETTTNDGSQINAILHKQTDDEVQGDAYNLLGTAGVARTALIEGWGSQAFASLELASNKGIPGNIKPNMIVALGTQILHTLEEMDYITKKKISNPDIFALSDSVPQNPDAFSTFYKVAVDPENIENPREDILDLIHNLKGIYDSDDRTGSRVGVDLLADIFSAKSYETWPSFEKPTEISNTQKNSFKHLPKKVQEFLHKKQGEENGIKLAQYKLFAALPYDDQLTLEGYEHDMSTVSVARQEEVRSKNAGIVRNIDALHQFVRMMEEKEEGIEASFYYEQSILKNMRNMTLGNQVNSQSYKSQRHLTGLKSAEVEIDPNVKSDSLDTFKAAVAVAFGYKAENKSTEETNKFFDDLLLDEDNINAIEAVLSGEIESSKVMQNHVMAAVTKGEEKMWTLDGLVSLAHYSEGKPFKTTLFREVDGITNGVIIGLIQLVAAENWEGVKDMLAAGGVFDTVMQGGYPEYLKNGNQDNYQTTATDMVNTVDSVIDILNESSKRPTPNELAIAGKFEKEGGTIEKANAVSFFMGELKKDNGDISSIARTLVKYPLMIASYGGSLNKIINEFASEIVDNLYKSIEKAVRKGDEKALKDITDNLNVLLNKNPKHLIELTLTNALEWQLDTKYELKPFKKHIKNLYGASLKGAIESKFSVFMERRTEMNNAMNMVFSVFYSRYTDKITAFEKAKGDKANSLDPIPATEEEKLEIAVSLQDSMPSFAGVFSTTEDYDTHILGMKSGKRREDSDAYTQQVYKPYKKGQESSSKTNASIRDYSAPGLSSVILGIHNIDSAIMMQVLMQMEALNVHDAAGFNIMDALHGSELFNQFFLETVGNYSIRDEIHATLDRVIGSTTSTEYDALTKLLHNTDRNSPTFLGVGFFEQAGQTLIPKYDVVSDFLVEFALQTSMDAITKKEWMKTIKQSFQYNFGGDGKGGYQIQEKEDLEYDAQLLVNELKTKIDPTAISEAEVDYIKRVLKSRDGINKFAATKDKLTLKHTAKILTDRMDRNISENTLKAIQNEFKLKTTPSNISTKLVYDRLENPLKAAFDKAIELPTPITEKTVKVTEVTPKVIELFKGDINNLYRLQNVNALNIVLNNKEIADQLKADNPNFTAIIYSVIKFLNNDTHLLADSQAYEAKRLTSWDVPQEVKPDPTFQEAIAEPETAEDLETDSTIDSTPAADANATANQSEGFTFTDAEMTRAVSAFISGKNILNGTEKERALAKLVADKYSNQAPHRQKNINEVENNETNKRLKEELDKSEEVNEDEYATANMYINGLLKAKTVEELVKFYTSKVKDFEEFYMVIYNYSIYSNNPNPKKSILSPKQIDEANTQVSEYLIEKEGKVVDDLNKYGSSGNARVDLNPHTYQEDIRTKLTAETTLSNFEALDAQNEEDSEAHKDHLRAVIGNIVNKVMRPLTYLQGSQGVITEGMYTDDTVVLDIGSSTLADGTQESGQTTLTHELLHAVLGTAINDPANSQIMRQVRKLFDEVRTKVNPMDLLTVPEDQATQAQKDAAEQRYNHIFNNTEGQGLHEFISVGATNERFIDILVGLDRKAKAKPGKGLWDKMVYYTNQLVDSVFKNISGTNNLTADKELMALVEMLAGINNRATSSIFNAGSMLDKVYLKSISKTQDWVVEPLRKIRQLPVVQLPTAAGKRLANVVQIGVYSAGIAASLIHTDSLLPGNKLQPSKEAQDWIDATIETHKRMKLFSYGLAESLITELRGETLSNEMWTDLLAISNKAIDQARAKIKASTSANILSKFKTEIDDNDGVAITKILLNTGFADVAHEYDHNDLVKLTDVNDSFIDDEIIKVKAEIDASFRRGRFYYKKHSEALGILMATGVATQRNMMENATRIANFHSLQNKRVPSIEDTNKAIALIDKLSTLYAIKNSESIHKSRLSSLVKREFAANPVNNGIEYTIQLTKYLQEQALERNFAGQIAMMKKGYVHEIQNPNTSYMVAPAGMKEELEKKGYTMQDSPLAQDTNNPATDPLFMFVSKNGLVNTWLKMVVSLTSEQAKGTDTIQVRAQQNDPDAFLKGVSDGQVILRRNAKDSLKQLTSMNTTIPIKSSENVLIPIYDNPGNITGYRYRMNEATKDSLLEKDNAFENILGTMHGAIEDKVQTKDINRKVVDTAALDYDENYATKESQFEYIGLDADSKEYRELYQMMPKDMRNYIQETWGTDGFYIRRNLIQNVFGYRKLTLTQIDMFNKPWIKQVENVWQEVVRAAKDAIVIKTGVVFVDNVTSNTVQLALEKLTPSQIARFQAEGIDNLLRYIKDFNELTKLELDLAVGSPIANKKAMEARVLDLKANISKNPVLPLIDDGQFQTILEDIDTTEANYTYRSLLDEYITKTTGGMNDSLNANIKKVGQEVFISHDTKMYKLLRDMTQYSDFVARYALHKYNMENKTMTEKQSLRYIRETFVNYDLATHPLIQYLNDVGLMAFTKFYFRTQKIVLRNFIKSPTRAMGLIGVEEVFGTSIPSIDDTGINVADRMYNPIAFTSDAAGFHLIELANEVIPDINLPGS